MHIEVMKDQKEMEIRFAAKPTDIAGAEKSSIDVSVKHLFVVQSCSFINGNSGRRFSSIIKRSIAAKPSGSRI